MELIKNESDGSQSYIDSDSMTIRTGSRSQASGHWLRGVSSKESEGLAGFRYWF